MLSDFDIKTVYLLLGSACNFHCKHCIQAGLPTARIKKQITPDTLNYLMELGVKRTDSNKIKIIFMGGEAFLYRSAMIEIVAALGNIFDYAIISNGSLITDEDVSWLNTNNITLILSNDGKDTDKIRDINIFENPKLLSRFLKVNNRAIEVVHHTYSQNLYDVVHYLEDKCPNTPFYLENMYCTQNISKELVTLDLASSGIWSKKLIDEFLESFKIKEFSPASNLILPMIDKIEANIDSLNSNTVPKIDKLCCGAATTHLNIDLQGNIYYCHNSGEKAGNIYEEYTEVRKRITEYFTNKQKQAIKDKNCLSCDIAILCRGSCPLENNKNLFINGCNFKKVRWKLAFDVLDKIQNLVYSTKTNLLS